jgi:hypothetical protein
MNKKGTPLTGLPCLLPSSLTFLQVRPDILLNIRITVMAVGDHRIQCLPQQALSQPQPADGLKPNATDSATYAYLAGTVERSEEMERSLNHHLDIDHW